MHVALQDRSLFAEGEAAEEGHRAEALGDLADDAGHLVAHRHSAPAAIDDQSASNARPFMLERVPGGGRDPAGPLDQPAALAFHRVDARSFRDRREGPESALRRDFGRVDQKIMGHFAGLLAVQADRAKRGFGEDASALVDAARRRSL